jgi:hypothetical protein
MTEALDVLLSQVREQCRRNPGGVCLHHPSGRHRFMGGSVSVKHVLWAQTGADLPTDHMLVRICPSDDCVEPACHVAQTRAEFGKWLGGATGWRRQQAAVTQ